MKILNLILFSLVLNTASFAQQSDLVKYVINAEKEVNYIEVVAYSSGEEELGKIDQIKGKEIVLFLSKELDYNIFLEGEIVSITSDDIKAYFEQHETYSDEISQRTK